MFMCRVAESQSEGTSLQHVKTATGRKRAAIQVWASFAGPLPDFNISAADDPAVAEASDRYFISERLLRHDLASKGVA